MDMLLPSSVENDDSPCSTSAEAANSDSQEQLIKNEEEKQKEGKLKILEFKERREKRRIASVIGADFKPLPPPILRKSLKNATIDLTTEDDDPTQVWFKKTFEAQKSKKNVVVVNKFTAPRDIPKNVPRSLRIKAELKEKLKESLFIKLKKGSEQRHKLYRKDNEHLLPISDEDEDEEEEEEKEEKNNRKKKKKTKKQRKAHINGGYESEEDEDYKENSSENEEKNIDEKSVDLFGGDENIRIRVDDELSVNLLDDSFTYDVFNNVKHHVGPESTSSFYDIEQNGILRLPTVEAMEASISKNDSQTDDFNDILSLCSGKFGNSRVVYKKEEEEIEFSVEKDKKLEDENDGDEEVEIKSKKTKKLFDSDEEEEEEDGKIEKESQEILTETMPISDDVEEMKKPRRVILSDEEEEDEEEEEEEDDEEKEERDEEDEEMEEEEEEEENLEKPTEPNFDDEDDELAVIKRIEYKEYQTKVKKKNFFDDEASLSGDDVGSDLDDDDAENNEYEAEEGDADDVPDNEVIRRENHKLLLKQETDREQRALIKLQDRLLADGDLGGIETNRQFRFKIREEDEVALTADMDEKENEEDEEEDEEETEEKRVERAKMLKFRIEKAEELILLDEPKPVNDPFERAGRLVKSTKEQISIMAMEETTTTKIGAKPSLLKKTTLAATFQEVLLNSNGAVPKQMYVQNYNSTSSTSTSSSNGAGVKRGLKSPVLKNEAKRARQSKLSALE